MFKFSQLLRSILAAVASLRGNRRAKRLYPTGVRRSTGKPHQGAQEMARRRRQIEKASGTWHRAPRPDLLIVQSDGSRVTLNSHGVIVPFYG